METENKPGPAGSPGKARSKKSTRATASAPKGETVKHDIPSSPVDMLLELAGCNRNDVTAHPRFRAIAAAFVKSLGGKGEK